MAQTPTLPQLQQPFPPASGETTPGAGVVSRFRTKQRWTNGATILALIIAILANFAIIIMIASRSNSAPVIMARPQVLALPSAGAAPPADPPAPAVRPPALMTTFNEGKFMVGTDIAPGTYRTAGKSGRSDCYWERLKDTDGGATSIIANDLAPGPATVTIDKTDSAFQTRWCSPWVKIN
jgi:hypothetical protein